MKKKLLIVFCSVQHHKIPPYNLLTFAKRISLQYPTIFIDLPTNENRSDYKGFFRLLVSLFLNFFKPKGIIFWQAFFKQFWLDGFGLKIYLLLFKLIRGYKVVLYTSSAKSDDVYSFILSDMKIADIYDNPDQIIEKNFKMIAKYDKVFANSKQMLRVIKKINKNSHLISAAYHNYSYPSNKETKRIAKTVVFYGGISHRINYEWLYEAVSKLSDVKFFFIGQKYLGKYYVNEQDERCEQLWKKIKEYKNVYYWPGKIDPEMAQALLSTFSLGIIPYDVNDSFNFNSHPMKLYDYLASNIPVLSSQIPSIMEYKNNHLPIYYAKDSVEFIKKIKSISRESEHFAPIVVSRIKKVLEKQSLEKKFLQIESFINE